MSGTKGMAHYRVAIKQEAVRLVLEEQLSYAEVASRLGLRKSARLEAWVRMYRQEGELSFHKPIGRPPRAQAGQRELERLRMENALLKKFHTELRGMRRVARNIGPSTTAKKNSQ